MRMITTDSFLNYSQHAAGFSKYLELKLWQSLWFDWLMLIGLKHVRLHYSTDHLERRNATLRRIWSDEVRQSQLWAFTCVPERGNAP